VEKSIYINFSQILESENFFLHIREFSEFLSNNSIFDGEVDRGALGL